MAEDNIECPLSVRAGKVLIIPKANIKNKNCDSGFTVNKIIVSLIGNSGKSGSSGLQGPFINNIAPSKDVPKATCQQYCDYWDEDGDGVEEQHCYGSYVETEGSTPLNNIQIIAKVPTNMKGQLALAAVAVLDTDRKMHGVGSCYVEVKP